MKVELGLSESAKTKRPEYSITLKVVDIDAARCAGSSDAHAEGLSRRSR